MSPGAAVEIESVSKRYGGPERPVEALERVSLSVQPGASLAITGPSGCGKSTLLGLIGGLERPTAGNVLVDEEEISAAGRDRAAMLRRELLGFVFQADNLLPFLTAAENVAFQLRLHSAEHDREHCLRLLEQLGVLDQADKLPDQLSGGQRQRVAVARALAHRPRLILADEPTGALDAASSALVVDLLLDATGRLGATLIVVTHDPSVAMRLGRAVGLRDGRVVADGGRRDPAREPSGA